MEPKNDRLTVRIFTLIEFSAVGRVAIAAAAFVAVLTLGAAMYAYASSA